MGHPKARRPRRPKAHRPHQHHRRAAQGQAPPRRASRARPPLEERRYLLLWKPYDVLSQFSPGASPEQLTLSAFVDHPGVYPAGRLDRDSEGLLLLTNDGLAQHKLCDPRFGHERSYWAQVEGLPSDEALRQLREGVTIKGHRTRPAQVRRLAQAPSLPERDPPIRYRASVPDSWIELTLTEGKNRQVRRMTAAVGHPTLRLVRARMCLYPEHLPDRSCCLSLDGLSPGAWRALSLTEDLWGSR